MHAADVGGHDNDRVLEINRSPRSIGEPAVLENLQQDVEDIRVRLLYFIEEHYPIGTAANGFSKLTAFFITHITRRCADEPGDGEPLHVFRHIDPHYRLFIIEEELRQGAGEFGLSHSGGPQEDERPDGALGIFQARAAAANRLRHRGNGLLLADNAAVKFLLHAQQFGCLRLEHPGSGNTRPLGDDARNIISRHSGINAAALCLPFLLFLEEFEAQAFNFLLDTGGLFVILAQGRRLPLRFQTVQILLQPR